MAKRVNSSSETTEWKANKTGNRLEKFVEQALTERGYAEFWNHKASAFANRKAIGGRQYLKQLPVGNTIYESTRHCDFFIVNRTKFPDDLIIECKWQQVPGSVDEKLPFLLFNILKTGLPTVVLLDGDGCRETALKWLKDQVHPKGALIHVWTMKELGFTYLIPSSTKFPPLSS